MNQRTAERYQLAAMVVFFAAYLAAYIYSLAVSREGDLPGAMRLDIVISALFLAGGGLAHACFLLGWKRALTLLGLCLGISYGAEVLFLHVFHAGNLVYTDVLGPKLPGGIPAVIPLTWFMMTYPAYIMANLILDGRLTWAWCKLWRIIWLSFITAVIHTAWDLSRNPTMSGRIKAWIWEEPGPYFGVPFENYWGWILVAFIVVFAYRMLERRIPLPVDTLEHRHTVFVGLIPIMVYALTGLIDMVGGYPDPVKLLVPFVMGVPVFLALNRLLSHDSHGRSGDRLWGEAAD